MLIAHLTMARLSAQTANDVVIITGIGAIFGVVGRWVFVGLRHQIRKEIQQPNGGNSVRDFIMRTDANMDILHSQMETMVGTQTEMRDWQADHDGFHRGFIRGVENTEAAHDRESRIAQ